MCLRAACRFDPEAETLFLHNGMKLHKSQIHQGGVAVLIEPIFDFAMGLSKLKLDKAEIALLAAILLMQSGKTILNFDKTIANFDNTIVNFDRTIANFDRTIVNFDRTIVNYQVKKKHCQFLIGPLSILEWPLSSLLAIYKIQVRIFRSSSVTF